MKEVSYILTQRCSEKILCLLNTKQVYMDWITAATFFVCGGFLPIGIVRIKKFYVGNLDNDIVFLCSHKNSIACPKITLSDQQNVYAPLYLYFDLITKRETRKSANKRIKNLYSNGSRGIMPCISLEEMEILYECRQSQ